MRKVEVLGVRVEMPTNHPIVLLREEDGHRHVPIWVGAAEASAIAYAQQGVTPPRPLTHDLLVQVIEQLGHHLDEVHITKLEDRVFYAELVVDGSTRIESRSSDAIAIALRTDVPILVEDSVLEDIGVVVPDEEDDEVERFREFLDHVSAEDFESPPESDEDDKA